MSGRIPSPLEQAFADCDDPRCHHDEMRARFGLVLGGQIHGGVVIEDDVQLAPPVDINAKGSHMLISRGCDVAAFVTITNADSHKRCLGQTLSIERWPVTIEDHVFIGQGAIILGGCWVGHHSVIGAGVVLPKGTRVPPYSRVRAPAPIIEPGFYEALGT